MNSLKTLLIATILLTGFSANARAYKCKATDGSAQYILTTNIESRSGVILESLNSDTDDDYSPLYTDAAYVEAPDDGGLVISGEDKSQIDWSKQKECFVRLKDTVYFSIENARPAPYPGELQVSPKFATNPKVVCRFPQPSPAQPIVLSCESI